ncbi:MAG: DNA topoisomerase III, partial [Duncaniella sp.]|nr:DNA topoisomerase III [Duncaniella sp.]
YSAAEFIDELKTLVGEIVINVLSDNSRSKIFTEAPAPEEPKGKKKGKAAPGGEKKPRQPRITKYEQLACPLCGSGHIVKGRTAFGCSRHTEGCSLRLFFSDYPETLTPSKLKKKLDTAKA